MTLGKSSSADSESPVPLDAVLAAVEECCTQDMQALMIRTCVGDIHINVKKKKCQIGNASKTSFKSKPTMAIPFSQSSVLDSVQPDHQVEA